MRREPRWVIPFLRALVRTGEARTAAEDAGIDHSTAYTRRRAHADFAAAWEAALRAHKAEKQRAEAEEIEALRRAPSTIRPAADGPPPPVGEELVMAGGQVKRAGHGRWSARKEAIFFEELAATANIKRSAAAAGVSYNAVLARRLKHPLFAAKWDAVVETAKASINMHLLEETRKSFDPETLDTSGVEPRVTIDQAIRISQAKGPARAQEGADPFAEDEAYDYDEHVADVRERIVTKLQRLRKRDRPALLAQGWSYDEEYDWDIPPGWVRAKPEQA